MVEQCKFGVEVDGECYKKYIVQGRKWFDKVNGNTYHSVKVVDVETNDLVVDVPFTYGYGDQWKQTAYAELVKKGLAREADRFNHDLNRERFIFVDVCDVSAKRDL